MAEFKVITYEKARSDFLKDGMKKAQNRMKFWQIKLKHAKGAIAEMEAHDNASNAGWEYNYYKDALEALENQPKWISVEEKHPDAGEWVLTYCGGYAKWFDLNKWCGNCWLKTMPVTHWMPLPSTEGLDAT